MMWGGTEQPLGHISFHRPNFKMNFILFSVPFYWDNFFILLFFNSIMRHICILFPCYRTALRDERQSLQNFCLFLPLVYKCKRRTSISLVNFRNPLECLWLPFPDLSKSLSTVEHLWIDPSPVDPWKPSLLSAHARNSGFCRFSCCSYRIFSFLFLLTFSWAWISSDLWMTLIRKQRFAWSLFLGNQSCATLWA